jgi:hypothetical protein
MNQSQSKALWASTQVTRLSGVRLVVTCLAGAALFGVSALMVVLVFVSLMGLLNSTWHM